MLKTNGDSTHLTDEKIILMKNPAISQSLLDLVPRKNLLMSDYQDSKNQKSFAT